MKFYVFLCLLFIGNGLLAQPLITGTISDENGEPLPGASVHLLNTDHQNITDADGFFMFNGLENRSYTIEVKYIGFETMSQQVDVNGRTNVDLTLSAATYTTKAIEVSTSRVDAIAPIPHTNLSKETLKTRNLGQDIPFLLRYTPSMVVTSDAGTGIGYTGIRLRGSDPSRINISINGIPLNDSESQNVFWVNMPDFATSTQEVQIQRGVGTSTNGTGAFGGTINLNTLTQKTEPYGQIDASIGSFNTLKGNVQFGTGRLGKFTIDGRLSHIESDGYIDRASADLNSYFGSVGYWEDKSSLILNVFGGFEETYQAWNGVPVQYIDNDDLRTFNTAGTDNLAKAGEPHDNEVDDYEQHHIQLLYNRQLSNNWDWRSALHYTKGKGFFELYQVGEPQAEFQVGSDTSDIVERRWLDNDFYGLTASAKYSNDIYTLILGGAANHYAGAHFGEAIWTATNGNIENPPRYYDNDADKWDVNFFAKTQYQLKPKWNVFADLQYRFVQYTFEGPDANNRFFDQTEDLHFFNPKIGATYQIQAQHQVYAFAGIGQREPNRSDYTESPPNTRPEHESMIDYELGYKYQTQKAFIGLNLYYMDYDNQLAITGFINDVGESNRINVKDSYRTGVELDAQVQATPNWSVNANLTLSQNKIDAFTEYIDNWDTGGQAAVQHKDTDLALSPNIIFGGAINYDIFPDATKHKVGLSLMGKYVGEQYLDNTSNENTTLDAYFFSDFRVSYEFLNNGKFFKGASLNFLVRNIFDSEFETNGWVYRHTSDAYDPRPDNPYTQLENGITYSHIGLFPQAGRNFLLGISLKF